MIEQHGADFLKWLEAVGSTYKVTFQTTCKRLQEKGLFSDLGIVISPRPSTTSPEEIHARAKDIFLLYHGIDSTNFSPLEKVPTVKQLGEKHNISQGIISRSFESANQSFFPRFKASATDILPTMTEHFQLGSWLTYRSGMQALGEQNKAVNDIWVAISGPNYSQIRSIVSAEIFEFQPPSHHFQYREPDPTKKRPERGFLEKPNINPPDIAQVLDVFRRYDEIFSLFEALAKFGKQK